MNEEKIRKILSEYDESCLNILHLTDLHFNNNENLRKNQTKYSEI